MSVDLTSEEHEAVIEAVRNIGPGSYTVARDVDRGPRGVERVVVCVIRVLAENDEAA
jgi:hypothetical protein